MLYLCLAWRILTLGRLYSSCFCPADCISWFGGQQELESTVYLGFGRPENGTASSEIKADTNNPYTSSLTHRVCHWLLPEPLSVLLLYQPFKTICDKELSQETWPVDALVLCLLEILYSCVHVTVWPSWKKLHWLIKYLIFLPYSPTFPLWLLESPSCFWGSFCGCNLRKGLSKSMSIIIWSCTPILKELAEMLGCLPTCSYFLITCDLAMFWCMITAFSLGSNKRWNCMWTLEHQNLILICQWWNIAMGYSSAILNVVLSTEAT